MDEIEYVLELDSNKKEKYIELLTSFYAYLPKKKTSVLHKYVEIILQKVKASTSEKIIFYHSDFKYVSRVRADKDDFKGEPVSSKKKNYQDCTIKNYESMQKQLDKYNKNYLKYSEYWLKTDGILINLVENEIFQNMEKENYEAEKIVEAIKPVVNNYYVTQINYYMCIFFINNFAYKFEFSKADINEFILLFIKNFLLSLKIVFIKPSHINIIKQNGLLWIVSSIILYTISYSILIFSTHLNLIYFFGRLKEIVPVEAMGYINIQKSEMITLLYSKAGYMASLKTFYICMFVLWLPLILALKSKVKFGQIVFINVLPTFLFLALGMNIFVRKLLSPLIHSDIHKIDNQMMLLVVLFMVYHFWTMYKVTDIRFWKFAKLYSLTMVGVSVFGTVMNFYKGYGF